MLSSKETMEGAGANNKANKQFDDLEGAEEPQIFSLAVCRLDLSNMQTYLRKIFVFTHSGLRKHNPISEKYLT